jgi:cell division protein FtsB
VTSVRRAVWPAVVMCVLIAALFLGVFPTRAYIAERREKSQLAAQIHQLREGNGKLDARVNELQTDAEIERLARSKYNLVRPGEEAYALLPAPTKPAAPPAVKSERRQERRGLLARAWHSVTSWA